MTYLFEDKESPERPYSTFCPKCGLIVPVPEEPCPWCDYYYDESEMKSMQEAEPTSLGE